MTITNTAPSAGKAMHRTSLDPNGRFPLSNKLAGYQSLHPTGSSHAIRRQALSENEQVKERVPHVVAGVTPHISRADQYFPTAIRRAKEPENCLSFRRDRFLLLGDCLPSIKPLGHSLALLRPFIQLPFYPEEKYPHLAEDLPCRNPLQVRQGRHPRPVTTDGHDSYPRAIRTTLGGGVKHRTSRDLSNRLEQDHRGIKPRYQPMHGFECPQPAERFCRGYDELRNLLGLRSRPHQHVSANTSRLLLLRRTATAMATLQAA
jgi:hypothetical protein